MKKRINRIIKAVWYVFNFRKPAVRQFHWIDLVAGNKLLFLLVWDAVNAGGIMVNPGRHHFRQATGAAVLTLLPATDSVVVLIRNCWRRTSLNIALKHVTLDKQSLASLTDDLPMFTQLRFASIGLPDDSIIPRVSLKQPVLNSFSCQPRIVPNFKYQNFLLYDS